MVSGENKYWFEDDGENRSSETQAENRNAVDSGFGFGQERPAEPYPSATPDAQAAQAAQTAQNVQTEAGASVSSASAYDPHGRHYQSDFAMRNHAPELQYKKSGRVKEVRADMLKKLLKYDFKALLKYLVPFYIAIGGLSVLLCILAMVTRSENPNKFLTSMVITVTALSSLAVQAISVMVTVMSFVRFYRNLYSSEGYLTLSIPATATEHVFSKIISSMLVFLLTQAVVLGAQLIESLPLGWDYFMNMNAIGKVYALCETSNLPVLSFFETLILLFVLQAFMFQLYYTCISLGQMVSTKNRVAAAIGFYFAFSVGGAILLSFFAVNLIFGFVDGSYWELFASVGFHGTIWLGIAVLAGLNVAEFFLIRHILKNKVNLA